MKKRIWFPTLLWVCLCVPSLVAQRTCETMPHLQSQLIAYPWMQSHLDDIEQFTANYVAGHCARRSQTISIPVVFHVLYNNAAQNIPTIRIQEQLDVLNQDFGRFNSDAVNTPGVFLDEATDTDIQFCLATRAPDCSPTTGIIRKATTVTAFSGNDNMKFNASGGDDAWPTSDYLNIWICNLGGGLLGYAQFPGGPAATDGVVVLYGSVGGPINPGTTPSYNLGRTATHEVGHWLNLRHIWGDANCGDDLVWDTPTQQAANFNCPTFQHVTCSNGPDGDMFMNYMDYTDDNCMNVFTHGQASRMRACLESARASLFNSLGCSPGQVAVDLYMRDSPDDIGNEPNNETGPTIWNSNDIWIRNANDGIPTHQNPINGVTNFINVRVFNKGCNNSLGTENLKVYWTKASTAGSWPSSWDGSSTFPCGSNPLRGNQVTTLPIPVIGPGGVSTFVIPWTPPTPSDYACVTPSEEWHFCLLARIESSGTSPYGMTYGETWDVGANTRKNNNIAWKNLHIDPPTIATLVPNDFPMPVAYDIVYMVPEDDRDSPITDNGHISIELGETLFKKWETGGRQGKGFEVDQQHPWTMRITSPRATFENLLFDPFEHHVPIFRITFEENLNGGGRCIFRYQITQLFTQTQQLVGGVEYEIHKPVCVAPYAGDDVVACPGCAVHLSVDERGDNDTYQWVDLQTGQVVGTTAAIDVSPANTTIYEVTVHEEEGCIGSDQVKVEVPGTVWKSNPATQVTSIQAIPNPFGTSTRLRFSVEDNCATQLLVYDALGRVVATLFDGSAKAGEIYEAEWRPKANEGGVYFVRLNACGHLSQSVKLVYLK